MRATCSSETSVDFHQIKRCYSSEDRTLDSHWLLWEPQIQHIYKLGLDDFEAYSRPSDNDILHFLSIGLWQIFKGIRFTYCHCTVWYGTGTLTVAQLVKKLLAVYWTPTFTAVFTTARHWPLSRASWIQLFTESVSYSPPIDMLPPRLMLE
jgi:hypothetical protein